MRKEEVDDLDRRWINAIIDGRPESEIRERKEEYIKASEKYAEETNPKDPRKEP
tara:strand:- start:58 stop:219 length:162 start_codon:yes stop_codon:yes gene_type:complete